MIIQAVRKGGPDPLVNRGLADIMSTAQAASVPKDIIERNIKRATDVDQADMDNVIFEAYGPGGSGWVVECLTDNQHRAQIEVWQVVKKAEGKMAESGSVLFNFKQQAQVVVKAQDLSEDDIFEAALTAGGDDIAPISDEEDQIIGYKIICAVSDYGSVRDKLVEGGLSVQLEESGLVYSPLAKVDLEDEAFDTCENMYEKLLDSPDVDAVYTTADGIGF